MLNLSPQSRSIPERLQAATQLATVPHLTRQEDEHLGVGWQVDRPYQKGANVQLTMVDEPVELSVAKM